jgi:hypothetical protein
MLALLTTVKWLFITTSLVDVGVLIVTTAKVELGLSSLHVKAIPRLKRICWPHVFEDAADLACRFERDRFEVVELRVVPVHRCSSSSSLAQGSLEQGRAAPARLARKEWAEKVGLELKLPSLPLGIGQLGRLSEAKTQSAKAA